MAETVDRLQMHRQAAELMERVYALTKALPQAQYYPLGNDIRRSSAAVCQHIHQSLQRYTYTIKLGELNRVRQAAEQTQKLLEQLQAYGSTDRLRESYAEIIRQSWSP